MKPGDKIYVKFKRMTRMPMLGATVTEIRDNLLYYRYDDDAPVFGGLRGMIRLPRRLQATPKRKRGRPRKQ